jgi:hypothetical protein
VIPSYRNPFKNGRVGLNGDQGKQIASGIPEAHLMALRQVIVRGDVAEAEQGDQEVGIGREAPANRLIGAVKGGKI